MSAKATVKFKGCPVRILIVHRKLRLPDVLPHKHNKEPQGHATKHAPKAHLHTHKENIDSKPCEASLTLHLHKRITV